ncbi:MAG: GlsB/YeaQ/YmgE family stress response membrane protein [Candidatus Pacebacteria bacterium CG10_big_fil_rev_8_21_14_0_10_42_12]|nr:MAG: GlsB/YeaQ/YmgE family stress response membrane protein [Candidatus Pacebacteria bacterium CG10_big_fil_rev_8_21_14_0_10_42_12]
MGLLLWILFGAIVGWISSMFMNTDARQGALGNIVMGIVGSIVAGYLMPFFGMPGVTGFNFYSVAVAVVGAMVVISVARLIRG